MKSRGQSRRLRGLGILAVVGLGVALVAVPGGASADSKPKQAAEGRLRAPQLTTPTGQTRTLPSLSGGTVSTAKFALLGATSANDIREEEGDASLDTTVAGTLPTSDLGVGPGSLGCGDRRGQPGQNPSVAQPNGNVRVNQDCSFRRQAEEGITFNPADPNDLLAGQNDSRVGFNQCGIDFSTDNGRHWGDMLPPFRQKVNNPAGQEPTPRDPNRHTILGGPGTLHTYDAASDPAVAFDSQGQGFFSCVGFDVFSDASMLFVTASPPGAHGSFFFNIPTLSRRFIVAEDNNPAVFHDKEFITADIFPGSPNRDNVYITWTVFRFSPNCGPQPNPGGEERFCSSPIFGSMSTDHARTWSTPEEISGTSTVLCFFGDFFDPTRSPSACDFNQGSDPKPLPNGDLVVVFNNGNTAATNPNAQQLSVKCHPTGSSPAGTARLNCAAPARVGDDVSLGEPQCDFGRGPEECVPGAFIRTNDFPRLAVNTENGTLVATWQDYRNQEYDIQLSESVDGGLTWSPSVTVNPDRGLDHYFPALDISEVAGPAVSRVGVSYFRTQRVPNENTTPPGGFAPGVNPGVQAGNSDYVLAGGRDLRVPYDFKVVSPVFPPPNGIQAGFNGDYSGLIINKAADAHPIWSDTRNVDPFAPQDGVVNDEDIFTDNVGLPDGIALPSVGQVGSR